MLDQIVSHTARESALQSRSQLLFGTPVFDEDASDAEVVVSPSLQAMPAASVVFKLLDRAAAALDSDRAAARDCIARVSALLRANNDIGTPTRGGLAPWQMRLVTRHIDASLASTVSTQDCAKLTRLSASYFSRAFKVSFGETFSKYVARRRTERAQEMMVMTDERLSEIALSCGFADQSHFTRVYHRQVGSSPASWRRQRRITTRPDTEHNLASLGVDRQWPQKA
jgi:AraC family transcriptional regulator